MPYDPTIYLGSAAHYRCGRPAYSPGLEGLLAREAGLDGSGRLLYGGCGPGVLTVRLAHLFREAVGLDPDADMLAEGARAAGERGITNIRWARRRVRGPALRGAVPGERDGGDHLLRRRSAEPHTVADPTADTFVAAITSFATFDPRKGTARACPRAAACGCDVEGKESVKATAGWEAQALQRS